MAQKINVDDIDYAVEIFSEFYTNGYPRCETVKIGLRRLLCDRYRNDTKSFTDNFVHPTRRLLGKLQEQNFPLFLPNGDTNLHIVPPLSKLNIGEYFYQVGHTNPGILVVKFAKYVNQGRSVELLQRARVPEEDHDIAFTKGYFDDVRKEAEPFGDPLLRTIIVLRGPEWSIQRVVAITYLRNCPEHRHSRLTSDPHLPVQESTEDESSTSESLAPNTPSENADFSSSYDVFMSVSKDKTIDCSLHVD